VPHVFRNKPFPAFWTAPERFEFLSHRRGVIQILWTDLGVGRPDSGE
jgi:hypothetical protein